MSGRVHVGSASDFDDGDSTVVSADGREVCVLRSDGEFFAVGNRCLHRGGPLHMGEVLPEISEDVENAPSGQRPELVFTDTTVVVCPWHGWEYDVATGEHAGDRDVGLPSYEVTVEDGEVYVLE